MLGPAVADRLEGRAAAVLALPRGGVATAVPVARDLGAPLDVILVRKIGAAGNPELAIGAVAEGGVCQLDQALVAHLGMRPSEVEESLARARDQLAEQAREYRAGRPAPQITGRTAVIVDDGIATGSTAAAAVQAARNRGADEVVVASPVASREAVGKLSAEAEDVVVGRVPDAFRSVGDWYEDFSPVTGGEVKALLAQSAQFRRFEPEPQSVSIEVGQPGMFLDGDLTLPVETRGVVIFAHGSGSGRSSPRNRQVARRLNQAGMATLVMDLLTVAEEEDPRNVFDIALLGSRVLAAVEWTSLQPEFDGLTVGLFGASTGAAAALVAAAADERVKAVVSRGGRPDLAGDALRSARAPVLLIVGGNDREVLELNRSAQLALTGPSELAVVPGAGHLFEEPGSLETVGDLAADWFGRHLPTSLPVNAESR